MNNLNTQPLKKINLFTIVDIFFDNLKIILITSSLFFCFSIFLNSIFFKPINKYSVSIEYTVDKNKEFYLKSTNEFLQNLSSKFYIIRALTSTGTINQSRSELSETDRANNIFRLGSKGYFTTIKDESNFEKILKDMNLISTDEDEMENS